MMPRGARSFCKLVARAAAAAWLFGISAGAQTANHTIDARFDVTDPRRYVYEPFEITLVVTADGDRLGAQCQLHGMPPQDILACSPFQELPPVREQRGDRFYEVRRFRCTAMAMQPGAITLAPRLSITTLTRKQLFFGSSWIETARTLDARPLTLSVAALPETGRPPDFTGAVGRFTFEAEVSPTNVAPGDIVYVRTRIRGKGYTDPVPPPALRPVTSMKIYAPTAMQPATDELKAFEQIVVPLSTNSSQIGTVSFCYFDPDTETYRTLQQGPFALHVKPRLTTRPFEQFRPDTPHTPAASERDVRPQARKPYRPPDGAGSAAPGWRRLFALQRRVLPPARAAVQMNARLAPGDSALATFNIPAGAMLRVHEITDRWARVSMDGSTGWVPVHALEEP
jgi:hypothetical protein